MTGPPKKADKATVVLVVKWRKITFRVRIEIKPRLRELDGRQALWIVRQDGL